jgi:thiamine biosynthesis lipoprotein
MGCPCDIQFYGPSESTAQQIAQLIIADVRRLEARYSRYREDSFLSEINRVAATGGSIRVDSETASLLNYADTCYQQSEGLFDITSGILRRVWSFKQAQLPTDAEIQPLLAQLGWDKVRWQAPELCFLKAGMELDLGGVVKEYAVDRAASLCLANGLRHGVINLGGDIKVIGARTDGSPWRIGIRHPRQADAVLETVLLSAGALASSGDYERCIVLDNVRYSHILNPKTGWPVRYLASVSVVSDFCVIAGSASTIAMLKEEQGTQWLVELGLPTLWVSVLGEIGGSLMR